MRIFFCFLLSIFIFTQNCDHNRVNVRKESRINSVEERRLMYFVFGLFPNYEFSNEELCAKGDVILGAHFYRGFMDNLVAIGSLGLITPKQLEVYCGEDP